MSLFDELKRATERDRLRFHTPGHKGCTYPYDLTELTDGSFPADSVLSAERRAAAVYGAKHSRFLCCGSSQGVKAAVWYAGGDILADINSHRSVFDGAALRGVRTVTAGVKGGVRPLTVKQIEGALTKDVRAVVVTTPTYFGYVADVEGIRELCKRRGVLFIADGAHGAHFGFSDKLPISVAPYCDICNLSTHKTLSSLTQSAILLDSLDDEESKKLSDAVDIMGSTSPSYLLYSSIDGAVEGAKDSSAAYDALYEPIAALKEKYTFLKNDDFTRLVLDCEAAGADSRRSNRSLTARGVYPELVTDRYIVFIITAADSPSDIALLDATLADVLRENK